MNLDLSNDWQYFDNRENLVLEPRSASGLGAGVAVANAVVMAADLNDEQAAGIERTSASKVFHLWANQIAGAVVPKPGDRLTRSKDGSHWVIRRAQAVDLDARFRCTCEQEV